MFPWSGTEIPGYSDDGDFAEVVGILSAVYLVVICTVPGRNGGNRGATGIHVSGMKEAVTLWPILNQVFA